MAKVTNRTNTPLGLPNGPVLLGKQTLDIPDWDAKSSNLIVNAWVETGALVVAEGETAAVVIPPVNTDLGAGAGDGAGDGDGAGSGTGGNETIDPREEQYRAMTNPELSALVTANGGTVKAGMIKDDLVALALEVVKV